MIMLLRYLKLFPEVLQKLREEQSCVSLSDCWPSEIACLTTK